MPDPKCKLACGLSQQRSNLALGDDEQLTGLKGPCWCDDETHYTPWFFVLVFVVAVCRLGIWLLNYTLQWAADCGGGCGGCDVRS